MSIVASIIASSYQRMINTFKIPGSGSNTVAC